MGRRIRHSRLVVVLVIVGSVFLLTAGAAFAATSTGGALGVHSASPAASAGSRALAPTGAISGTQPMTGGTMIAGCIAAMFEVPISDVADLHSQGFGYGQLAIAYALTQEISPTLTVSDILGMRDAGMGLGEIAQFYGLHPGNSDRNLGRLVSGRVGVSGTETVSGTVSAGEAKLAERLGADPGEVAALLEGGASYGDVIVAFKLAAKYEGVTAEELVGQRSQGDSWGQIKRDLKAPAPPTTSSQSGAGEQGGPPEDKGRPDHASKPDHAGKPEHAGPKEHNKGPK